MQSLFKPNSFIVTLLVLHCTVFLLFSINVDGISQQQHLVIAGVIEKSNLNPAGTEEFEQPVTEEEFQQPTDELSSAVGIAAPPITCVPPTQLVNGKCKPPWG